MSYSVILTKFNELENGEYTEKDSKNIESTLLPKALFDEFAETYFTLVKVHEEDAEDQYEVQTIQENKINELMDCLKILSIDKMTEMIGDDLSKEEEDKVLNDIRIILNLRNIILTKSDKHNDDKSVMLVVG